ncbi:MAG: NUDIX domain-containing protein [Phycisphaerales bacterium]|nr:NUDIX domain-containing protein [Phycisphaerales bacterium]
MSGARVRSDIVDVYVFRRAGSSTGGRDTIEFLQLRRSREPMRGTWQPVMGHVEAGETSAQAAMRELREEAGLDANDPRVAGFWALERVHPFYLLERDEVVLSPRFAVEVAREWEPMLDASHDAHRWVTRTEDFHWADQHDSVREILERVIRMPNAARDVRSLCGPRRDDSR